MKKFEITLENGNIVIVEGMLLTQCEATGQCFIYSENNPIWQRVVAVVPVTGFIRVL